MAFCAKCGAQMAEGNTFCSACGAPVGTAVAAAPTVTTTGMSSNVAALVAYVLGPITGTAFLLIEPYRRDKFVRFHAFQSIFFCIGTYGFFLVLRLLISLLSLITFGLGGLLAVVLVPLCGLAFFLLWLFLLFKAYSSQKFMVPYIGSMAAEAAELNPDASNVNGFLAYVLMFITGVVLLVNDSTKQDKFVRFHALQSIFFSAALFVLWVVYVVFIIGLALVGGFVFLYPLVRLVSLAIYAYSVILMQRAYRNELYKIPVIGDFAAKQAGV